MNKQIDEMAKVIDEYTEPLSARDIHKADFPERFAEALYNAGYRKQEWISVEERLPERQGAYLVFTCDRRISMCHFIDHYCDGNMQFDDYRVTHWMPLPKAPKGDKTDA